MAKLTVNQLRSIIKELIKIEFESQKQELLKEVKAELFDLIMETRVPAKTPSKVNENTEEWSTRNYHTGNLRSIMNDLNPLDNFAPPKVSKGIGVPDSLPSTFTSEITAPLNEKQQEQVAKVAEIIFNKDYSALMKKLG